MGFDRLSVDHQIMGGVPCIAGTRIPVATIVAMVADRITDAEIIAAFPQLDAEAIRQSLLYAAEALRERAPPALRLRLLVDECLSAAVADQLAHAGHDAVHVTAVGLAGRSDREVMALAVEQQRIIISADTDFGELLAQSGAALPSIVLLRRSGHYPYEQAALLISNLPALEPELAGGAIAVIANDRMRVRTLPL